MKNVTLFITFCLPVFIFSQNKFTTDFEPIRAELKAWDDVRGEWLSESLESMVNNQAIPSRTFPEDFTPAEMLKMVPQDKRTSMLASIEANYRNSTESSQANAWREMRNMFQKSACKPVRARSYGDPHLSSFDGASFSFQTVGEFILAKSSSENFEIQSRQRAEQDDFSLNTAVALNVGGDRLCIYANEMPDQFTHTPLRLNGEPIVVEDRTYFLPKGGTIRYSKKNYTVDWPSGETATFELTTERKMNFMNVSIQIFPCVEEQFSGVLGNANDNRGDDFNVGTRTPQANFISMVTFGDQNQEIAQDLEKEHLAYIAKEFASQWRVTPENTLFDYGFNENTYTFTDLRFPMVHRTVRDLTPDQRTTAQRTCENQGLTGAELRACVYDQGFLNIEPIKRPTIVDRTEGVVLAKIEPRVPKVDPVVEPTKPNKSVEEIKDTEVDPSTKTKSTEDTKVEKTGATKPVKTNGDVIKDDGKTTKPTTTKTTVEDVFPIKKPTTSGGSTKPVVTTPTKVTNPVKTSTTTPTKTSTPVVTPTKTSTPVTSPTKVITPIRKG
ncbi:MAG: VWD domain-containing protein [Bacteroidota bacterium]